MKNNKLQIKGLHLKDVRGSDEKIDVFTSFAGVAGKLRFFRSPLKRPAGREEIKSQILLSLFCSSADFL